MLHEVFFEEQHTINVIFNGFLSSGDAEEISNQVIDIILSQENYVSIILDVTHGHTKGYLPILKACMKLSPHLEKFYKCYVIGNNEENIKYLKMLFNSLRVSDENIFFLEEISEVHQLISNSNI